MVNKRKVENYEEIEEDMTEVTPKKCGTDVDKKDSTSNKENDEKRFKMDIIPDKEHDENKKEFEEEHKVKKQGDVRKKRRVFQDASEGRVSFNPSPVSHHQFIIL